MIFNNAKWIWKERPTQTDTYVEFHEHFVCEDKCDGIFLYICAESDYTVHLNGMRAAFGQFSGYVDEKYYDCHDLSALCQKGENSLRITVRYEGVNSARRIDCGAGVIYSLTQNRCELLFSHAGVRCCESPYYRSVGDRRITVQLGLASDMITPLGALTEYGPAVEVELPYRFLPRPVRRLSLLSPISAKPIGNGGRKLYDLGREDCGYIYLKARCSASTTLRIAYGEHTEDGGVRYLIGGRSFYMDFICREGINEFEQLFVRVAGRYLEIVAGEAEILDIGIIPVIYPLTERATHLRGTDKQIYDTCVRTLRLCMHEHYEDCPWREQALYVLDSRNQMLCGYTAFEETEFQRANLVFISKGLRSDGMLELTYPAINTPAIPFFSAMYPVAVCEYIEHTGDTSIAAEVMPTMLSILARLDSFRDGGTLIKNPPPPYWNFYEWSEGNSGVIAGTYDRKRELILNCAFVLSVAHLRRICALSGLPCPEYDTEAMKAAINDTFFDTDTGIFYSCEDKNGQSVLGNAFALLIGLGDARTVQAIKSDRDLVPATLSMMGFVYDALLACDAANADLILADIRQKYSRMLERGATSFWETEAGADDFGGAGSLCHGWSAIPIHYLTRLAK